MPFDVPDDSGDLPIGDFDVTVTDARTNISKNGNPQIILDLEEIGGARRTHTAFVTVTKRGLFKLHELYNAFGLELKAGEENDEADFIGRSAHVEIGQPDPEYPIKVVEWSPPVGSDIPSNDGPTLAEAREAARDEKFGADLPWES